MSMIHESKELTDSSGCGSQADTAIIRDREIASGKAGPLGRTQGNGVVDAAVMVGAFMGAGAAPPANNGAAASVGVEDNIPQANQKRQFLSNLLGGLGGGKAGGAGGATGGKAGATGIAGLLGGGGEKVDGPPETRVAAAVGAGATSGLPTCADDGTVTMTLRQVSHILYASKHPSNLFRSTKTVLDLTPQMSMVPLVVLTKRLCSPPPLPKMFQASVSRVSRLLRTQSLT
jgi:hypothetical protein